MKKASQELVNFLASEKSEAIRIADLYCFSSNVFKKFKGIFNITKNPIYLVSSLAIYILKLILKLVRS